MSKPAYATTHPLSPLCCCPTPRNVNGGAFATGFGARNSVVVGVGMIPRGEVGLITASIGFAAGLIPRGIYVQVIVLVLATTLITPALLRLVYARREAAVEPSLVPLPLESATQQEFVSPV